MSFIFSHPPEQEGLMITSQSTIMSQSTILIAIPDNAYLSGLVKALSREGLTIQRTTQGDTILSLYQSYQPALIILTDTLSDCDSLDLCQEIRRRSDTVHIMLLSNSTDKVAVFSYGVDDVQALYTERNVLVARIEAHLRRIRMVSSYTGHKPNGVCSGEV